MPSQPLPCPVCAALVLDDRAHIEQHVTWHAATKTLGPKGGSYATADGLRAGFHEMRAAVQLTEDRPTERLPPLRETILRRPPAPDVRELKGAALLRALADAIGDDEDLDDDDREAWQRVARCAVVVPMGAGVARCQWPTPDSGPCLSYGADGCAAWREQQR